MKLLSFLLLSTLLVILTGCTSHRYTSRNVVSLHDTVTVKDYSERHLAFADTIIVRDTTEVMICGDTINRSRKIHVQKIIKDTVILHDTVFVTKYRNNVENWVSDKENDRFSWVIYIILGVFIIIFVLFAILLVKKM